MTTPSLERPSSTVVSLAIWDKTMDDLVGNLHQGRFYSGRAASHSHPSALTAPMLLRPCTCRSLLLLPQLRPAATVCAVHSEGPGCPGGGLHRPQHPERGWNRVPQGVGVSLKMCGIKCVSSVLPIPGCHALSSAPQAPYPSQQGGEFSEDGNLYCYSLSSGGSDWSTIHLMKVKGTRGAGMSSGDGHGPRELSG